MTPPRILTRLFAAACASAVAIALIPPAGAEAGIGFKWARATPQKGYADSLHGIHFEFMLGGKTRRDMQVEVVRHSAGVVQTLPVDGAPPATRAAVRWNGLNVNGKPPKPGTYVFKVRNPETGRRVRMKKARGKRKFSYHKWIFPVRGRHSYGGSAARYGAGRSGHSHQGHDVFAPCGARIRSPRGGRVQTRAYHSSAGHYVVIDLVSTPVDAVFMHLKHPSWARQGQRVFTGQQIGKVGDTGNARGCHLHFELWSGPGWYEGGHPYDPLPHLLAWDSWS